jgi:hypothetical protein
MKAMSRVIPLLLVAACAKADKPATEAAATAAAAPAAISLQDVAGTWAMKTFREGSDSVLLTFQMTATNSESGWSFTFPGREPVPVRVVAVAGDSIMTEAGPYESALRKGSQVSTRSVMRLSGGKLAGSTVATYANGEELRLRTEGMAQ